MRQVILHGHIFKNAGTTFDWSLRNSFGDGFLDHREDQLMLEEGGAHLSQMVRARPTLSAISSHHMTRDFPALPGVQFLPVYFLRHPVSRIRSVYDFERDQQADTPGALAARSKSFRDYVAWRMLPDVRPVIRNYQTLYLAGEHRLVSREEVARHCFSPALEHLAAGCLVGIVERYDESMVVMEESLREHFPTINLAYVAQNVSAASRPDVHQDDVVAATLAALGTLQKRVIDENSLDLALYQVACVQLQARIDSIEDFPAKLQAFRSRCP